MYRLVLTAMLAAVGAGGLHAERPVALRLPEAFHGEWTTQPEACHADPSPFALWQVSGRGLITEEGGADILTLEQVADNPAAFDAVVDVSGGGGEWRAKIRLTIDQRRMAMDIEDLEGESALARRLWRCADPIPAQFVGEWATETKDCGVDYASFRVTPGGFVSPEVGERTLMVKPTGGNPDEVLMEASVSIADISFDEQRVLRLSPDGKQLTILSLGQIGRASADPDWQPNPYARFRPIDDPEQVETLLRCPSAG